MSLNLSYSCIISHCRAMLRKVEEQPADTDNYVRTSYGVAAVRCHHKPVSRRTIMALAILRPCRRHGEVFKSENSCCFHGSAP